MMQLAFAQNDRVAAVFFSPAPRGSRRARRSVPDSVGAASARLDLIGELLAAGKHVDAADLDDALRVIQAQDPSWHVAYRAVRLRGLLAVRTGRLDDATAAYLRAEMLASACEGPGSLTAAMDRSQRAAVRLQAGKADEAGHLVPSAWPWPRRTGSGTTGLGPIAANAAAAAERVGDTPRAIRLRRRRRRAGTAGQGARDHALALNPPAPCPSWPHRHHDKPLREKGLVREKGLAAAAVLSRHGRACPGHPPPHRPCADGRDTPGQDGDERTCPTKPVSAVRLS